MNDDDKQTYDHKRIHNGCSVNYGSNICNVGNYYVTSQDGIIDMNLQMTREKKNCNSSKICCCFFFSLKIRHKLHLCNWLLTK